MSTEAERNMYSLWNVDDFTPAPARVKPFYDSPTRSLLSLDGIWQVQTDPENEGFEDEWFIDRNVDFSTSLNVPGNWNIQGLGGPGGPTDPGAQITQFSLREFAVLKGSYCGMVWYRKEFDIPSQWQNRCIQIVFGGVMTSIRLWVNGTFIGGRWTEDGDGFYFDITEAARPGEKNVIIAAVDNRWNKTATLSHTNWYVSTGGIFNHVSLRALPRTYIKSAVVYPKLDNSDQSGTAEIHLSIANELNTKNSGTVNVMVHPCDNKAATFNGEGKFSVDAQSVAQLVIPVEINPVEMWTFEHPNLYKLEITIKDEAGEKDSYLDRFGMRKVESKGGRFLLNSRPTFLLGQHFNFFWPDSLTPPITKEEYLAFLKPIKKYGFNYLRTPWFPPHEAFDAADELGMMIQLEMPYAYDPYDKIKQQLIERLLQEVAQGYGNHPSLVVICMSNEGSWDGKGDLNNGFCKYYKNIDPTRLVIDTDGRALEIAEGEVTDLVVTAVNVGPTGGYLFPDVSNPTFDVKPVVAHEFLNVPTLANPKDVESFSKPYAEPLSRFVTLAEDIHNAGLDEDYPVYLHASYKLQALLVKSGMEALRKHPRMAGYSMCAWNDVEWYVRWGIANAFGKPKLDTSEQMRRYNSPTALLLDDGDSDTSQGYRNATRRCGEAFELKLILSHYGDTSVSGGKLVWSFEKESGEIVKRGELVDIQASCYKVTTLPPVEVTPFELDKPEELVFRAHLTSEAVETENLWPFWIFPNVKGASLPSVVVASDNTFESLKRLWPEVKPLPSKGSVNIKESDVSQKAVWVTEDAKQAMKWLKADRHVLLLSNSGQSHMFHPGWFMPTQKHLGTIVRDNVILGDFPHRGYASWQFYHLLETSIPYERKEFPATPAVSSIYDDTLNEKWEYEGKFNSPKEQTSLFSARVGDGFLTFCSLTVLSGYPESDYLLWQLLQYSARSLKDTSITSNEITFEQLEDFLSWPNRNQPYEKECNK